MPRPKGSRNKSRKVTVEVIDFAASIADANEKKAALEAQKADLEAVIAEQKNQLKAINKELASIVKAIGKLEVKKAEYEASAKAEAAQQALNARIQELVDSGSSYDDIMGMLNK